MWKFKDLSNMCLTPGDSHSRVGSSYRPYSPTAVTNAFFAVTEDGESIRGAARKFSIPEATLRDRVSGRVRADAVKSGREPLFSAEEEAHLVDHLKVMASFGYGYSRSEVVDMATVYAISLNKRTEDQPLTLMWFSNFMKRWPELKVKKPRGLELQRAKATSEECVNAYFQELDKILTKYDLKDSPEGIYNIDEKGLRQNHTPPCVVTSSQTVPMAVTSGKGSTVTVIGCGNALGQNIPPYFVFPGKRMRPELLADSTPGADGTVSDSGWSNSQIFQSYLEDHFMKYVQGRDDDKHILVLYDGHRSHISLPLIDWAKKKNILLFILPAHTSHVLQPLDVGCFGPFERIYNAECHKYMRMNSCSGIDRYSISKLASKTYSKALSPENLQSSFRKAGIYPFDPTVVDKSIFIPAKVLRKPETTDCDPSECIKEPECDLKVSNHTVSTFFSSREATIGPKEASSSKKRRCLSAVVSGKAITEETTIQKINEHHQAVTSGKKKQPSKTPAPKSVKTKKTGQSQPQPGTSGTVRRRVPQVPQRAAISLADSSDEEIDESEKCCVCHQYQPAQLAQSDSVYFTQWGQCMFDNCLHWTHLKYCCSVKRLNSKATFYCPCHGLPCMPLEE